MLDREPREKLQCQLPFFFVVDVTVGRLGESIFGLIESLGETPAILFYFGLEGGGLIENQQRVAGKVEENGAAIFAKNFTKLPARIETALRGVVFATGCGARAGTLEDFGGIGKLGEWEERGALDGADGALGVWVEGADGFDGIAEEFDADRLQGLGREHVDDAAANRELAG